jgi:hypothetical protein
MQVLYQLSYGPIRRTQGPGSPFVLPGKAYTAGCLAKFLVLCWPRHTCRQTATSFP